MYICYIDEAGCTGDLPDATSAVQPVFTILGLIVSQSRITDLTRDLIQLKRKYFPRLLPGTHHYLDWMMAEVKGSEIRKAARHTSRNKRRFAFEFVRKSLEILESHNVCHIGRVFIKPHGARFDGKAVYSNSVQRICSDFQHFLLSKDSFGMVIADSRNKALNSNIAHSVFTQWHRASGNPYPNILEVPTFGHSNNHAGIQFCDLLCSSLYFPIAAAVCCLPHMQNHIHCHKLHLKLRSSFGSTLRSMEYRYQAGDKAWGGIHLSDPLSHKSSIDLFA